MHIQICTTHAGLVNFIFCQYNTARTRDTRLQRLAIKLNFIDRQKLGLYMNFVSF